MNQFYREFGRRLRAARLQARLSQASLAKAVDVGRTSITNIERGRQHVSLHMAFLLANALNVRVSELLPDSGMLRLQPVEVLKENSAEREWVERVVGSLTEGEAHE